MAKYLDQTGLAYLWDQIDDRKVSVEDGKGLSTNDYTTEDKNKLASLENYDDSALQAEMKSYAKDIEYSNGELTLKDAEGNTLKTIDVSDFIKDGMLQDVSIVDATTENPIQYDGQSYTSGKFIKFEWNTDTEGGFDVDYIMASEIGKVYSAGTAIDMTGDVVSVKVAEGKNYLAADAEGLKVTSMDTDATKITAKIPVAGGPLAEYVKIAYPDGVPAGTDMQSFLMKLICQEIYPSTSFSAGTLSASMTKPTVTLSLSGTQEVGTQITTNTITATGSKATTTSAKVSGFTYGYSESIDGDIVDSDVVSVAVSIPTETVTHSVELSYTGFTETAPAKVSTTTDSASVDSQTLIIREGTNKVTANVTGSSFTATSPAISTEYYVVSNIGGRSEDNKSVTGESESLSASASNSNSASVTGAYKYFLGWSSKTTVAEFNSASVRALNAKTDWISSTGTTTVVGNGADDKMLSNGTSIVVAVPSTYKLATINTTLGPSMLSEFTNDIVSVTTGTINTDYRVYILPITSGTVREFKNVTITKA